MAIVNTTDYQKLAEKIVRESGSRPDFSYSGNLPIGVTWALTFARHRDSKSSEVRHYEVVRKSLKKQFPDDVQEERFGHWAVGWIEELAVRMLDEEGNVTGAGKAVIDKAQKITEV